MGLSTFEEMRRNADKQPGDVLGPVELAHRAGRTKDQAAAWHEARSFIDNGGIGGVGTLEPMLRLMWPNPDRHQDGTVKRKPSRVEAEAVVHLAVTIVQWARSGALVKR